VRVGDAPAVVAAGVDHVANDRAVADIQTAFLNQVKVHGGIEVGIVGHVVHVAIHVVVHPARGDGLKDKVIGASWDLDIRHGSSSVGGAVDGQGVLLGDIPWVVHQQALLQH